MLKRITGFTVVAVTLAIMTVGVFQRNAEAHEVAPALHPALKSYLTEIEADYRWGGYSNSHLLVVINRGTAKWTSVEDACIAITERDNTLSGMRLILQDGKSGTAEIRWEGSGEGRVLTNMPSTDVATC